MLAKFSFWHEHYCCNFWYNWQQLSWKDTMFRNRWYPKIPTIVCANKITWLTFLSKTCPANFTTRIRDKENGARRDLSRNVNSQVEEVQSKHKGFKTIAIINCMIEFDNFSLNFYTFVALKGILANLERTIELVTNF